MLLRDLAVMSEYFDTIHQCRNNLADAVIGMLTGFGRMDMPSALSVGEAEGRIGMTGSL